MEFRELQYFLAVVEEGTISGAAEALHVAQPSLSRQMRELEEKIGKTLFIRGNRKITLTEEGMILRKRAGELLHLMEKTEQEIANTDRDMAGDIYIGAAETDAVHFITRAAGSLREEYPDIHFHIASGDTNDTLFQLDQGLIDFALLFYLSDGDKYNMIQLPVSDSWGVLMKKDHPLSAKESISFKKDLIHEPLIMSRLVKGQLFPGISTDNLNITSTYNLAYNASLMVEDGLGIAVCFDSIINVNSKRNNDLVFVPINDMNFDIHPVLIWKKYQVLSRTSRAFIEELQAIL